MIPIEVALVTHQRASKPDDAATAQCSVCVHPRDAHDAIAMRFCAATTAHALARGCACRR
jgi:hypothetical protein